MEEVNRFEEFFVQNCENEIQDIIAQGKKSVDVDFSILDAKFPDLADKLLNDPEAVLDSARKAIAKIDLITDKPVYYFPTPDVIVATTAKRKVEARMVGCTLKNSFKI